MHVRHEVRSNHEGAPIPPGPFKIRKDDLNSQLARLPLWARRLSPTRNPRRPKERHSGNSGFSGAEGRPGENGRAVEESAGRSISCEANALGKRSTEPLHVVFRPGRMPNIISALNHNFRLREASRIVLFSILCPSQPHTARALARKFSILGGYTFRFRPSVPSALPSITGHRTCYPSLLRQPAANVTLTLPGRASSNPVSDHPNSSTLTPLYWRHRHNKSDRSNDANRSSDLSPMQSQVVDFQPADSR
jgi:hypothetical protein